MTKKKKPLEHQIYLYRMFQYQSFELNCSAKFQGGKRLRFRCARSADRQVISLSP